MTARHMAKRVIETLLLAAPRSPRHMRGRSLILAYHNVVPDGLGGLGDQSLHLPLGEFTRHIDLLQRHCLILPLAEVLAGARWEGGPVVALTFDDAYRGAVELALPRLASRGLPSTLFVAPGLLGRPGFWWDELALGAAGLAPEVRATMLQVEAGRHNSASANGLPTWYGCASRIEVEALGRLGSVTFGAHTWTHPNLTRITPTELADELSGPLEWLRTTGFPMLPVLAYPYGLSSPAVETAVAEAGYDGAVRIEGGWLDGRNDPWRIPRYNVPAGLSRTGLQLRLSGVLSLTTAEPVR